MTWSISVTGYRTPAEYTAEDRAMLEKARADIQAALQPLRDAGHEAHGSLSVPSYAFPDEDPEDWTL